MLKDKQEAIEKFCELQSLVGREIDLHHYPYDCFCGKIEKRDGYTSMHWANAGHAFEWIEDLVIKEVRRNMFKRRAVALIRNATDAGLRFLERRMGLDETTRF